MSDVLTQADVKAELEQLVCELTTARNDHHRAEIHRLCDKWLDKSLAQSGAHPAECDCDDCQRAVADALTRRLGECTDPRDVASVAEFGHSGTAPT